MNKKAILFSVYIVFVAAIVFGYALFTFISSRDVAVQSSTSKLNVDEIYSQRDAYLFYSQAAGEIAARQTFVDIATEMNLILNPFPPGSSQGKHDNFDSIVGVEEFSGKMKNYFDAMLGEYPENRGKTGAWVISAENGKIKFNSSFSMESRNVELKFPYSVDYSDDLRFYIDFEQIGLESFEKIYQAKINCKTKANAEEIKNCFEKELKNFNAEVDAGKNTVMLKTKRKFSYLNPTDKKEIQNDISFTFGI